MLASRGGSTTKNTVRYVYYCTGTDIARSKRQNPRFSAYRYYDYYHSTRRQYEEVKGVGVGVSRRDKNKIGVSRRDKNNDKNNVGVSRRDKNNAKYRRTFTAIFQHHVFRHTDITTTTTVSTEFTIGVSQRDRNNNKNP